MYARSTEMIHIYIYTSGERERRYSVTNAQERTFNMLTILYGCDDEAINIYTSHILLLRVSEYIIMD
jgi:hypothetical protein